MQGIMLPLVVGDGRAVDVDVVVAVDVDVDIASSPVEPVPTPNFVRNGDAGSPEEPVDKARAGIRVPIVGRVGRIPPRAVDDGGLVDRHVNIFGSRRLDDDVLDPRLRVDFLFDRLLPLRHRIAFLVSTG